MKRLASVLLTLMVSLISLQAQDVIGQWNTIDDETGNEKSVVEIFEENDKIYGKVIEIKDLSKKDALCEECPGKDKGKPVNGLVIIKGLKKDGDEYNGGKILDPNNGKLYKCYITLEEEDKLKVRGYVGFALMGRTQYWDRVK